MDTPVYLDNVATTKPSSHLLNQMQPYFKRHWQSPTAPYIKGKEPFTSINGSVDKIYAGVGANKKDTFVFTSCGAEAISQVFHGVYFETVYESGKNHFLTSPIEDASIFMMIERFESVGCSKKLVTLSEKGHIILESLEESISPRTVMLSLSYASGLTGVIQPIADIAELCQEKGILLHVDVSDILGKIYFCFEDMPIDFLTFDGDRIHAPKGTGGLFIRSPRTLSPLIADGTEQNGNRGGTLNVPGIIGLGFACDEFQDHFDHMAIEIARLRNKLENGLLNGIPNAKVFFHTSERLPSTTVIGFPGVPAELLAFHLAENNIFASFGGGRTQKLESILQASGVDPLEAKCALSFSLSRDTTEEEIDYSIGVIVDIVNKCTSFSGEIAP